MDDWHKRKAERTKRFHQNHGLKMIVCGACNGSGHYDHNGAPPCGWCGGLGKVHEDPPPAPIEPVSWRDQLARTNQIKALRRRIKRGA